ncbi:MAG: NADH-quinone oxidoreductase subunit N [Acidobacteriia bacterium]|nr:NADH-quinone oxidoreductase subunit N [Terriglobia bacterium]
MTLPQVPILPILPELILTLFGIAVMLFDPFTAKSHKSWLSTLAFIGVLAALGGNVLLLTGEGEYYNGLIIVDSFSLFFNFLFLIIAGLSILVSRQYLVREGVNHSEYYALLLFATVGMCFMGGANELIMIFIGLEITSISTYVLAGFRRTDLKSNEAAIKYFLLGSFATAFLLYGIALTYGATHTTHLSQISSALLTGRIDLRLVLAGTALMMVGFSFKVATAPFQIWTPDVYEGAPIPITGWMSVGPKAAGFAAFLRVFFVALPALDQKWFWVLWVSAVLTMTIGNTAAMLQSNIKRMLAYSSIAHAGYILVAFAALTPNGIASILFYLLAYSVMNLGAFAVISAWSLSGERRVTIDEFAGLGYRHPWLAAAFTVFLLGLTGIPLTAGFTGKFFMFRAAINSKLYWLTLIALLNSAASLYYYLRPTIAMYMRDPGEPGRAPAPEDAAPLQISMATKMVIVVSVLAVFYLGLFPSAILDFAQSSAFLAR